MAAPCDVPEAAPYEALKFGGMLLCMALSSQEVCHLVDEIHRVVRPGGILVYSVRTTMDAHHGAGRYHGDDLWESGGFVVRFFDRALIEPLVGRRFDILAVADHEEGELPRRLWAVTVRPPSRTNPTNRPERGLAAG